MREKDTTHATAGVPDAERAEYDRLVETYRELIEQLRRSPSNFDTSIDHENEG